MRKIKAAWLYPISQEPIKDGLLILDVEDRVLDVVAPGDVQYNIDENTLQHEGAVCPGFVNTHCHLELSYLRNKIAEHSGLDEFIKQVEMHKTSNGEVIYEAMVAADQEMQANGIVAVGDISNTNATFSFKNSSNIHYHTFIELYAFHPDRAAMVFNKGLELVNEYRLATQNKQVSIVPHAPYSASPELLKHIGEYARQHHTPLSIHNQETPDENELFLNKKGKIIDRLHSWGIDTSFFNPTNTNALESAVRHLPASVKTLLVHNTCTTKEDIAWAIQYSPELWWCLCPNANMYIENRLPDFSIFPSHRVTIGTDSLASNHQLSVLSELQLIRKQAPAIDWQTLLTWGTLNGAQFLGIEDTFGSFEKGKKPGLVFIEGGQLC